MGGTGRTNLRVSGINPSVAPVLGEGGGSMLSRRSRRRSGHPRLDGAHSLAPRISLGWPCHGDRSRSSLISLISSHEHSSIHLFFPNLRSSRWERSELPWRCETPIPTVAVKQENDGDHHLLHLGRTPLRCNKQAGSGATHALRGRSCREGAACFPAGAATQREEEGRRRAHSPRNAARRCCHGDVAGERSLVLRWGAGAAMGVATAAAARQWSTAALGR